MGRELKRVPLDFAWPIGMLWKGYINPIRSQKCGACEGSGYSPFAKTLHDLWYGQGLHYDPVADGKRPHVWYDPPVLAFARRNCKGAPGFYGASEAAIEQEARRLAAHWNSGLMHHLEQADVDALIKAGRLLDFTHTFVPGKGWQPKDPPAKPTAEEVNSWSLGGLGHDSLNCWVVVKARCGRAGMSEKCAGCQGEGAIWATPEIKKLHEEWQNFDPPAGDGYQLWSTTTEGHPQSPVFQTLEALCEWAATNATTFGSSTATAEEWMQMLGDGFVYHQEGNAVFL